MKRVDLSASDEKVDATGRRELAIWVPLLPSTLDVWMCAGVYGEMCPCFRVDGCVDVTCLLPSTLDVWVCAGVYGEMQTDPPGAAVQWKHAGLVLFLSLALYWGQQVRVLPVV